MISLTMCSQQASTISLPCYLGFTDIAIWPAAQAVSKVKSTFVISRIFQYLEYFLLWSTGCENDLSSSSYWSNGRSAILSWPLLCCLFGKFTNTGIFGFSMYKKLFFFLKRCKVLLSTKKGLTICCIIFAAFMSLI